MGIEQVTLKEALQAHGGAPGAETEPEPEKMGGRPSEYRPEFADIARGMARLGGTDFEISEELGVTTQTLWRWRSKYPEFCYALDEGKEAFDTRIERSLAMRAIGYSIHTERVFQYEGSIVRADIVEHIAPDVGAIKLWLSNRKPDQWREKQELRLDSSEAFLACWRAISDGTINKMLG
jgi:hypothetical protein